mmetsp:Transcript_33464/g.99703  ORF Transcript_33464/g.99703 Transcript_33464/m.99703 type:complete len:224 (+) Transcript_33464:2499-3170(+)
MASSRSSSGLETEEDSPPSPSSSPSSSSNSFPSLTTLLTTPTIASMTRGLRLGTCLMISSRPVPTMLAISFNRHRDSGIAYSGRTNTANRDGNGSDSLTAAAPSSVRDSAERTLGIAMIRSDEGGTEGAVGLSSSPPPVRNMLRKLLARPLEWTYRTTCGSAFITSLSKVALSAASTPPYEPTFSMMSRRASANSGRWSWAVPLLWDAAVREALEPELAAVSC